MRPEEMQRSLQVVRTSWVRLDPAYPGHGLFAGMVDAFGLEAVVDAIEQLGAEDRLTVDGLRARLSGTAQREQKIERQHRGRTTTSARRIV